MVSMSFLENALYVYGWVILCLTSLSVTLAITGTTLCIRRTFVRFLLKIFEAISEKCDQGNHVCDNISEKESDEEEKSDEHYVIKPDASKTIFRKMSEVPVRSKAYTIIDDSFDFVKAGIEAIIEDDVTCRFTNEQLRVWNLLTRTSYGRILNSPLLLFLWLVGLFLRYVILLPIRFIIFNFGLLLLIVSMFSIGYVKNDRLKKAISSRICLMCFRVLARALSIVVTYHNRENVPKPGSICVANHTSPLDVQVLSMDNCYALVGQKQGGLLGFMQRCMSRANKNIWFKRTEIDDRHAVRQRLKEHVEGDKELPILIFPEGTCINNTSVMMFRKGCFEVPGASIYPVAIKYDARLGDAFWNSAKYSYFHYVVNLMTSWATVVNVWYLPPVYKESDEDGIKFAARVKHTIAQTCGLTELEWDGQLKRYPVKKQALERQKERWGRRVNRAMSYSMDNN